MNRRKNDRHRIRNIVVSSSKNDDDYSFNIYLFIVTCLSSRKWKRKTKKCRETLVIPIEFEYGDFQGPFQGLFEPRLNAILQGSLRVL